jgi:Protein of unknown function (DUF429)
MSLRTIAIDWSGAVTGSDRKIWLAEAAEGQVIRLEGGRDRDTITQFLIAEASRTLELVVGIDFAFSLPAWFLEERGLPDAAALWDLASREGEQWLAACEPPFWGRPGRGRPELSEHLRQTDRDVPTTGGIRPKSVFQIGGAGAVGTGSIRGMPMLKQLREAGFAVWPFDTPRFPMVIEIYPRVLTGAVMKGSADERRGYLEARYPNLEADVITKAVDSDDAFDALVSALVMSAHAEEFSSLKQSCDAAHRLEGQIWLPSGTPVATTRVRGSWNSSRTRVAPVFQALTAKAADDAQWVRRLLDLVVGESQHARPWRQQDVTVHSSHFEPAERGLQPPVALLSWLVRNLNCPADRIDGTDEVARERRKLAVGESVAIERALGLLRRGGSGRAWYVLEGPTYPDVLLVTSDALVVIEGKRTEAGPTTSTTWMPGRHQMLRHLDAAWEIRGRRSVYGFFVVEAEPNGGTRVPRHWRDAADATRSDAAVGGSLPHRSPEERAGIVECFLGVTTWQAIVAAFGLDPTLLLEQVASVPTAGA